MKVNQILAVLVGTTMLGLPLLAAAQAQKVPDLGKREYDANCAVCHGVTGKGDGPYPHPMGAAADLTVLAKKNGGVFPFQAVYEYVDGARCRSGATTTCARLATNTGTRTT
jgi:mono/diheme cytochrome c family protein